MTMAPVTTQAKASPRLARTDRPSSAKPTRLSKPPAAREFSVGSDSIMRFLYWAMRRHQDSRVLRPCAIFSAARIVPFLRLGRGGSTTPEHAEHPPAARKLNLPIRFKRMI